MTEVPAVVRISRSPARAITTRVTMDKHDLCVAGYVVDQFIEMFADLVIDGSSVFHR